MIGPKLSRPLVLWSHRLLQPRVLVVWKGSPVRITLLLVWQATVQEHSDMDASRVVYYTLRPCPPVSVSIINGLSRSLLESTLVYWTNRAGHAGTVDDPGPKTDGPVDV